MNNQPVAWARQDGVISFHKQKEVDSQGYKWFPLYTHPVKELTDEEIHELANEHLRTQNQDGSKVVLGLEDFAKAILRKAQENDT